MMHARTHARMHACTHARSTYYTPHRSLIPVLMQFLRFAQKLHETGKNEFTCVCDEGLPDAF